MIAFREVWKSFGGRPVLQGFSLEVHQGETLVILGYSGSGKSVALKHVVGLLAPDQGEVEVDGEVVHQLEGERLAALRAKIGFVFQFGALLDSMTVRENLELGLKRRGLAPEEIERRVRESLALVELPEVEGRYPAELSGGMKKRVGIARAVALEPQYILYDEPTTGLDPVTAAVIDRLILRAQKRLGATQMVVTHDLRSAYTVGDRIAMLYQGRIRQVGTVEQIQRSHDPVVRQFIEGRPEAAEAADAVLGEAAR